MGYRPSGLTSPSSVDQDDEVRLNIASTPKPPNGPDKPDDA